MTNEGLKKLAQWYLDNYPKQYPADMGVRRLASFTEQLKGSYGEYEDGDVMRAHIDWRNNSRYAPFPNEIIPKLPKPKPKQTDDNGHYRRTRDADGCVYMYMPDKDNGGRFDWTCVYKPWWTDDDPRVLEYFKMIEE